MSASQISFGRGEKGLTEEIVGDGQAVVAVSGDHPKPAVCCPPDAVPSHQPLDAAAADRATFGLQCGVDARRATAVVVLLMKCRVCTCPLNLLG